MSPIGRFNSVDINDWLETFNINFSSQVYLLHSLLPFYTGDCPHVLFLRVEERTLLPKIIQLIQFQRLH